MKTIHTLNTFYTYDLLIQDCCQKAKENPFDTYIWICDHPFELEQMFFQYTHHLVNIEIMTYSQYLKKLQLQHHLSQHKILSQTMLTFHMRNIFLEESFYCFETNQPYPLIQKLIPLMKDYELNQTSYSEDITQDKLIDFIHFYHALKNKMTPYEHLSMESLLEHCLIEKDSHIHLFIDGSHLYQKQRQSFFKKLDNAYDVTVFYTHRYDNRSFNKPYDAFCQDAITYDNPTPISENLFSQSIQKSISPIPCTSYIAKTPLEEVKRTLYTIYQQIIDEELHYKDFVIVYPDESYIPILIQTLNHLHIPHNLPEFTSCVYENAYQTILRTLENHNPYEMTTFKDISLSFLQEDFPTSYQDYFKELSQIDDDISYREFKEFFTSTYTKNNSRINSEIDILHIYSIQDVFLSSPKHIYFLGLNETIFPRLIKDTALLLDEDISILRQQNISTPPTTGELLGIHHNDILKAFMQPALSLHISYPTQTLSGQVLLESSLYKQLTSLFDFTSLPPLEFLPLDDYYLQGGLLTDKKHINQIIQSYKETRNQPDYLSPSLTQQLYKSHLSVSQIETYNKCPFLYYIQYGLEIFPSKDKTLQSHELGSLVHYILSQLIDTDKNMDTIVEHYLKQNENLAEKIQSSFINQYFIQEVKKDLRLTLTILKRQLDISQFQITYKEKKFEKDIQHLHFKGFVDRIDEYKDYVSIIDYKSSQKDIDLNLAMQGFHIQMLVYLKMVTEIKQKKPGAVLYFNTKKKILKTNNCLFHEIDETDLMKQYRFQGFVVDDEKHTVIQGYDPYLERYSSILNISYVKSRNEYSGHILSPRELEVLFEKIEEHILDIYHRMMQGDIQIQPKGSDQNAIHMQVNPCRYCPYHSICGFDVFYNEYQMVEFLDVKKILRGDENAV